ncbi:hypothetical protein POX_g08984 [Penicillium oxalicum]|uniref:hypothetical protein n=1 Tax=Penicillium oxalicum TaxID=69781 RepID=UPI0020B678EE|nr:hypothetical protein POX_g08984 [Penicillium oxalicum]KAI2786597.1 hypothetical protein POX_g08984 [Penicillium oxalicum]
MAPAPTLPETELCTFYEHPAESIIPHLVRQMPYASPVLRRIQHSLAYPSATARILATFPPGATPGCPSPLSAAPSSSWPSSTTEPTPASPAPDAHLSSASGSAIAPSTTTTPWLVAHVDLFRGRETQIILYSSLEAECTFLPQIDPVSNVLSRDSGPGESAKPAEADRDGNGAPTHSPHTSENHTDSDAQSGNAQRIPKYAVASLSADPERLKAVQNQLLVFLSYLKTHLLPEYLASISYDHASSVSSASEPMIATTTKTTPSSSPSAGASLIPPPDPRAFLIGTFHTGLFELLLQSGTFPRVSLDGKSIHGADPDPIPGLRILRYDNPPYYKYYFPRAKFSSDREVEFETPLPQGYRYHDRQGRIGVLPFQLNLVQSRTIIPRPRHQLLTLPSVAIYHDDGNASAAQTASEHASAEEEREEMPIAWAFLGVDGAVVTLFVEPEHRGRGLALALSKEVMRKGMSPDGVFGAKNAGVEDEAMVQALEGWVHAEVAGFNWASRRVMEKVGGEVLTTAVWAIIEVVD